LKTIEREKFVPSGLTHLAYALDALPLGANQWISSPLTVAKMTLFLEPKGADSVLEIGCGSGYQAAILSQIFRRVFSIERIERLLVEARARFKEQKLLNINTKLDDGQKGWAQYAPFDRILLSASIPKVPESLFEQLSDNGILVAPVEKDGAQIIMRYTKKGVRISSEVLEKCVFVGIKDGIA